MEEDNIQEFRKNYFGTSKNTILSALNRERLQGNSGYDVILVAEDKKEFQAHRKVLGAVSKFFDRMFKAEMKEQYEERVVINNISACIMKVLLEFIYTSKVNINQDNVVDLLVASDYLELKELIAFCVQFIFSIMDETNCIHYYELGIKYNLVLLMDRARDIVVKKFEVVATTEEFKVTTNVNLLIYCLTLVNTNNSGMKAKSVYEAMMVWVAHDVETRKEHCLALLELVKPRLLSNDFLKDVVLKNQVIKNLPTCTEFINREIYWKSIKDNNSGLQVTSKKILKRNQFVMTNGQTIVIFDVPSRTWLDEITASQDTTGGCIVANNNMLYMVGCNGHPRSVFSLDLDDDVRDWKEIGETLEEKINSRAAFYNGMIIIGGGGSKSVEMFEPVSRSQMRIGSTANNLVSEITQYCDCLYCIQQNGEVYKLEDGNWKPLAKLDVEVKKSTSVEHNHELYVAGYRGTSYYDTYLRSYDKVYNTWALRGDEVKCYKQTTYDAQGLMSWDGQLYRLERKGNLFKLNTFDTVTDEWEQVGEWNKDFECTSITAI